MVQDSKGPLKIVGLADQAINTVHTAIHYATGISAVFQFLTLI